MISRRRSRPFLLSFLLIVFLFALAAAREQGKDKPDLNKVPKQVMEALKAKFPKAEVDKWTREKEGDVFVHDFEFRQEGRKLEADIREDGTILNWERQIAVKDLPGAVLRAIEGKYPKAVIKEGMAVTDVKEGKDLPEGYEVLFQMPDGKRVEVTVAPDGKFLEESGEEK